MLFSFRLMARASHALLARAIKLGGKGSGSRLRDPLLLLRSDWHAAAQSHLHHRPYRHRPSDHGIPHTNPGAVQAVLFHPWRLALQDDHGDWSDGTGLIEACCLFNCCTDFNCWTGNQDTHRHDM